MAVVRSDWHSRPIGAERWTLEFERAYTGEEFERLQRGVLPEEMEDKWFVFYEEPWLYLHRSWTGICCFQVRFEESAGGARIVEVLTTWSRDSASKLLGRLLDSWSGRAR